jgi:hypothetical protein
MARNRKWLWQLFGMAAAGFLYLAFVQRHDSLTGCTPSWVRDRLESKGFVVISPIKNDSSSFYVSKKPVRPETLHLVKQSERIADWRGVVAAQVDRDSDPVETGHWEPSHYEIFAGFIWFGDAELIVEICQSLDY